MSLASESTGSAPSRARRSWLGWLRWRFDRGRHSAIRVTHQRVEVSWVSWVEAAVVEINFPLEITDQPIGLDEDGFAGIDRVKATLTPSRRRCRHHHPRAPYHRHCRIQDLNKRLGVAALPAAGPMFLARLDNGLSRRIKAGHPEYAMLVAY